MAKTPEATPITNSGSAAKNAAFFSGGSATYFAEESSPLVVRRHRWLCPRERFEFGDKLFRREVLAGLSSLGVFLRLGLARLEFRSPVPPLVRVPVCWAKPAAARRDLNLETLARLRAGDT